MRDRRAPERTQPVQTSDRWAEQVVVPEAGRELADVVVDGECEAQQLEPRPVGSAQPQEAVVPLPGRGRSSVGQRRREQRVPVGHQVEPVRPRGSDQCLDH